MDTTPKTLLEAVRYFSDLKICNEYMRRIKWPRGKTVCPKCGNDSCHELVTRPGTLKCNKAACQKQFSFKVGTIFEDSPLGLDRWFVAVWAIANCKNGISSHELGRALGVTQRTAWFMLHRIRKAMETGDFRKLDGEVEADEAYIGGVAANMHAKKRETKITGRGGVDKTAVQCVIQRDGNARAFVVHDADPSNLRGNVLGTVAKDSALYTDSATVLQPLSGQYRHEAVNHSVGEYVRGRVSTNRAENFISLLKRALKGTYVAVAPYHLFRYCHEQEWRYNFRDLNDAGRFLRALAGVLGRRLTYRQLAAVGDCGFMGLK